MSERPRVLLDCDPGHDDAFALFFAAHACELVAVTTVSGNVGLDSTTRNALVVRDVAGVDVPVHAGADRPLVAAPMHAEDIHGESGLDGPEPREPRAGVAPGHAVDAILEAAHRPGELWLVATGPLTNVALALRKDPSLAGRLAGISIMGGSRTFGNVTAAAEFNILADPEAAAAVFTSGARVTMAGLDLTHQFLLGDDDVAAFRDLGNEAGAFAAELLSFFLDTYERHAGRRRAPMHDPCAVMAVTHPHLFEREQLRVDVELRGEHTRGMTLCDVRDLHRRREPNATVLTGIDAPEAVRLLVGALEGGAAAR